MSTSCASRQERPNNRVQATAGVSAALNSYIGRAPAAPDAERSAYESHPR